LVMMTLNGDDSYQEGHKNKTNPCSDKDSTDRRDIPRYAGVLAGPTEQEDTDYKGWASNHGTVKSILRWRESSPFLD